MKKKLAIFGGNPVRTDPFPSYDVIGDEEKKAVMSVLDSGILSRFLGAWHDDFYGGPQVQAFEQEWAEITGVGHAVSVNSNTSGLYAAVGAAGVGPGDEVIVSPYTMTASATAALIFQGVPVFADIDPDTYCISAETILPKITSRTKAIIVVHIFGQTADMEPIMELARQFDIIVIEDCAQVPFAKYKSKPAGSIGDMGVFSLNYHKHIHTGEGGMVTTNSDYFAERLQLIRNHAEAVVANKGVSDITNMIGFNFRLGEIEAAIGREQLKKGQGLIRQRQDNVHYLEEKLDGLDGLTMPFVNSGSDHVYYKHTMDYDTSVTGISRDLILRALRAELPVTRKRESEGSLITAGYVKPIYLEPMYQSKIAFGPNGYPFTSPLYKGKVNYSLGVCPNVERAHFERVILHELMRPGMSKSDLDDVAMAFHKVWGALPELKANANSN